MNALLFVILGLFGAYALYIASLAARRLARPADFVDAGRDLPAWCMVFAGTGIVLAGLGMTDHFRLIALYGLPYSGVALGLVLVALCSIGVQQRLSLAARITATVSPVELLGAYYGSIALRIFALVVVLLFAVPFAAYSLALTGELLSAATGGAVSPLMAICGSGLFLFLFSSIGGWRGVIFVIAAQTLLVLVLMGFAGAFCLTVGAHLPGFGSPHVPGVVYGGAGIGRQAGAVWTGIGILSFSASLIGIVLSPGFGFFANTIEPRPGFAFTQVWMTAGLAAGLLVLVGPLFGAELGASTSYAGMLGLFAGYDRLAAIGLLMMLLASLQIGIAFFASAGAAIVTTDLVRRFVLPDLTGAGERLTARIVLAGVYAASVLVAAGWPALAAISGSLTLSLSAQLLPAMLGLCWVRWISRGGVLVGLIAGSLLVFFTEPPGLLLFDRLFVPLPWGRWPLSIHSAAWGLAFNIGFCLIVSAATLAEPQREQRDRLHDLLDRASAVDFGSPAMRGAMWSLPLMWVYFALGPGSVIGNSIFSHRIQGGAHPGGSFPSLWMWQIVFWLLGVLLLWWLAYYRRLSISGIVPQYTIALAPRGPAAAWVGRMVLRLTERAR